MRIISGGQTGVDRAALDAARELGIPHGGWCPRGRRAEDGRIAERYPLSETREREYWVRTERNVIAADATLIACQGPLRGGTKFTYRMTAKHARPCLVVQLAEPPAWDRWLDWLATHHVDTLNCAGPRESSAPGIYATAKPLLREIFRRWQQRAPLRKT